MQKYLLILTLFFSTQSSAQLWGPKNYEDCVLQGMKGISSDHAARVVQIACLEKFPKKEIPTPQKKTAKCSVSNNTCRLRLFNGTLSCRLKDERMSNTDLHSFTSYLNGVRVVVEVSNKMSSDAVSMWTVANGASINEACGIE